MENWYLRCRIEFCTTWLGHVCCVFVGKRANGGRVWGPWRLLSSRTIDRQILQCCSGCSLEVWCFCWSGYSRLWKRTPGVDGLELYKLWLCTLEKQHVGYARPRAWRAFLAISVQCSFQLSLESMMMPRYFQESFFSSRTLLMRYPNWLGLRLLVMVSTKHFSDLNLICQRSDQDWNLEMSSWRSVWSLLSCISW